MGTNKLTNCVLLVDDDPINGFLNAQLVSRLGIASTVKTVSNALEAVEFIRQCCILEEGEFCSMLIFLDTHSSVYNGVELLGLVNSMTNKVLEKVDVIVLTSSLDKVDVSKGTDLNILGFIEKPLTSEKLQKVIGSNIIQAEQAE